MLTVAYCRVSTEEQAIEGYSIDGQADELRSYAELHDLGEVMVIADPGRSGKDMNRPGLQQLMAMVERGHVGTVLLWQLDRLSRNLGDLVLLADTFGRADVALHSFTEKLDLSSATGRMFYNILGSFAQFYRSSWARTYGWGCSRRSSRASGRTVRSLATRAWTARWYRAMTPRSCGASSSFVPRVPATGPSNRPRASATRPSTASCARASISARRCTGGSGSQASPSRS